MDSSGVRASGVQGPLTTSEGQPPVSLRRSSSSETKTDRSMPTATQARYSGWGVSASGQIKTFGEDAAVPAEPNYDPVKIPQHYNTGKIEVANFIADQCLAYPADNIIKYVVRAGKKDSAKEIEDIEKAAAYLQMMHNLAHGLPAVVRDPETKEVVWSLFRN